KEKEDIQRRKQLERAERNRLAALKKLQAKAAKQASSQVMADGSSQGQQVKCPSNQAKTHIGAICEE
ncbi:unnamed protein product, partial [Linum tenue]